MHQQQPQQPSLSKRWACDRCRNHKLRCSRTQGSCDSPCVRCARAGAECVTGDPMPLGRPRHNAENKSSRLQASRKSRSSVFIAVTVPGSTRQASTSTATPTQPEPDAVAESSEANAQTPAISNFGCVHNPLIAEAEALPSLFLDEGVLGGQSSDTAVDYDPDFGFPNDAEAMDLAYCQDQEDLFKSLDLYIDPAFQRQALSGSFRDVANRSLEPSLSSSRILAELAHLNGGIAQQLTYMDSLVHSQPPQHLAPSCVDKVGNRQFNPLPGALESTAALVTIIKQIISPIQDQGPSPVTTPVVLMCLSGYIQLLQIFNAMFCHLHRLLRGLSDISSFFENLPEFGSISGLPAVQGDLYIKVAIQVVQHNVSSLEKAIGLPPELCLSPQRAPSKSLLSHMESPDWFWGLMNQACSPAEKSANALISSLRTEIGNVLGLVNI